MKTRPHTLSLKPQTTKLQTNSCFGLVALLLSACDISYEPLVYPDADSASAQLYQAKCAKCHNAPQPHAHTAQAWPAILHRMQMRMITKGATPLNKSELNAVLDYLQRYAAPAGSK
ncbi:MAG: hypothetical protein L3J84_01660 [Gammaproteobacteria bacterium]|nr:hypothetical protein [Gammaproteobacteria bacterium]